MLQGNRLETCGHLLDCRWIGLRRNQPSILRECWRRVEHRGRFYERILLYEYAHACAIVHDITDIYLKAFDGLCEDFMDIIFNGILWHFLHVSFVFRLVT